MVYKVIGGIGDVKGFPPTELQEKKYL